MKKILIFIFLCCAMQVVGQTIDPKMEMLIFPKYMQGNSGARLESGYGTPCVYRAKITGLKPLTTYRYENKMVNALTATPGGGSKLHYILPPANVPPGTPNYNAGDFYKAPTASGNSGDTNGGIGDLSGYYGVLTTDKDGSYTGWFIQETVKYNGKEGAFFRVSLNNPDAAPNQIGWIAYMVHSPIEEPVYTLGTSARENTADAIFYATAIRSTPTKGSAKNIVLLYDNVEGTGRPIATTFLENDGVEGVPYSDEEGILSGQSAFYKNHVDGVEGTWGAIVVNTDPKGIRRIEQRSLVDGSIVGYNISADGTWPDGENTGGTVNTANTSLGANAAGTVAIVIDGSKVTLAPVKDPQTVNFTNVFPAAYKVGDPDFVLSAGSSAGLTNFVYSAAPAGILQITGNTVKIIGGGTAMLTVTQPGTATVASATAEQTIKVEGIPQVITGFPLTLNTVYGDAGISLSAVGGASGNPVVYASGDVSIAEIVDGNQIRFKKSGTVVITASQQGNAIYSSADELKCTLTIGKADLTVTATDLAKPQGSANPTTTFSYAGFKNDDDATTLSGSPVLTIDAGTDAPVGIYDIDVDVSALMSDKYTFIPVKGKLTVSAKQVQTITLTGIPAETVYGSQPVVFGAVSTTTNEIVFSSSRPDVVITEKNALGEWTLRILAAGESDITASQAGDSESLPGNTIQHIRVAKAPLHVIAEDKSKLTGEADPAFTVRYEGFVNAENEGKLSGLLQYSKQAQGSDFLIIPSGLSADNYELIFVNGKLTVGSIAFATMNKVYGDLPFDPGATSTSGVPTYRIADLEVAVINENGLLEIKGAGTTAITASFASGASGTVALTVGQKEVTVTANPQTRTYRQANPLLSVNYSGFVYRETEAVLTAKPQITTTAVLNSLPGNYAIVPSGAQARNYKFSYQQGVLTINNEVQQITFDELPVLTYGDADYVPSAASNAGILPVFSSDNPNVALIQNGRIKIVGSGAVNIVATFAAEGFATASASKPLLVNKRTLMVRAENMMRVYGQSNPALTASYEGFVNGETLATAVSAPALLTTTANLLSPVGTYAITAGAGSAQNYTLTYESGILTVNKALLTVAADNKSRVFATENPVFTLRYSGFVNAENESVLQNPALATTAATILSPAGVYPIVPANALDKNYEFSYLNGVLTVTATGRTIIFDPLATKFIGDADYVPFSALSSGETAVLTSADPTIAMIVDNKIHLVGPGTVLITASAPVNPSYNTRPSFSRYLVVSKKAQTISFEDIPVLGLGVGYTLKAKASSGLPVTFTVANPQYLDLNGNVIKGSRIGKLQVSATQAGDGQYEPATTVVKEIQVVDAAGEKINVHKALSVNGDGVNDFLSIDGIKDFPINKVTIVNKNGLKVFYIEGYDNDQKVFRGKSKSGVNLPQGTYFCLIEYHADSAVKTKTGYFILKY